MSTVSAILAASMETCSNCGVSWANRKTYCPYCGCQLTHPVWKKAGAWVLLIMIIYGLVSCHLRLLDGLGPAKPSPNPASLD